MGYVVTMHDEREESRFRLCLVLQPSGRWTSRLKDDLLKPPPEGTGGLIKIFATKEEADKAAANVEDRGTSIIKVQYVDAMPHHSKCPGGTACLCGLYRSQDRLQEFVAFVRRAHVGHDVEKGCTTGICKEIKRLEEEGLVSRR